MSVEFVDVDWAGRPVRIEHRWLRRSVSSATCVPEWRRPAAGDD